MGSLAEGDSRQRSMRHGGIEVLRITEHRMRGERPMERHVRALCNALVRYAEQTLFSPACAALECAVREGRAFSFSAQEYCISHTVLPRFRFLEVRIRADLRCGEAALEHSELVMRWTRDGKFQLCPLMCKKQ